MIKFFRKIRYNLMSENKAGKYFKYAVGEILLVVIGILIALQINNWNEERNNQATLKQFLMEFREELKLNIQDFKFSIKEIDEQRRQKDNLLKNKRLDTMPIDTLEKHIETRYVVIGHNPALLRRFENAQIANYGKYDSIFIELQEFYGFVMPEYKLVTQSHNESVNQENDFWIYSQQTFELKLRNGEDALLSDSITRKKEFIKLIQSTTLRNMLKSDYRRKTAFKRRMKAHIQGAERMLKDINQFLE